MEDINKISLIIPVYNGEKYISRCLDSIIDQTYRNYEVIIVDDGSTDSTPNICDKYAEKDERIKVFHIANGGVSNARNYALSKVSGDWFGFIDADDWVTPHYLEILYNNAVDNGCQVSGCCFSATDVVEISEKLVDSKVKVLHSPEQCIHNFICPGLSLNGMVWGKLYRTSEFVNIKFDTNLKVNEDCIYTYDLLINCSSACVTTDKLYYWFTRDDSACHKKPSTLNFDRADVFIELLDRTKAFNDKEIEIALKKNFVNSAVDILLHVPFDNNDEVVKEHMDRILPWKSDIWGHIDSKQKIKILMVTHMKWLLPILRFIK